MKDVKLYDMILPPLWLLMLSPVLVSLTVLLFNFVIDSLVLLLCFYVFKIASKGYDLKVLYRNSIVKVCLYGLLADIIGTIALSLSALGLHYEFPGSAIFAIIVATFFIYWFNYRIVFKKLIREERLRFMVAFLIAVLTQPWTLLFVHLR